MSITGITRPMPWMLLALSASQVLLPTQSAAARQQADSVPVTEEDAAVDLQSELPFDPSIRKGTLANGLTYYIRPNTKPENRAELWLAVNAGSIQEDDDQQGLAHFVEHMAFNGTQNFAKQELVDYLESIGMRFGPDINAYTSFDETVYTLRVPTDDPATLDTAFQILEDWAHGVSLEGEEIDKERGVVVEEWRLGRGAEARIRDSQFPVLFRDSRYADRLPIGQKEILETAPYAALLRFYREWYRPDLMAVIAVGDFDADEIEAQVKDHFGSIPAPSTARPREEYPVPDHEETLYSIDTDPELTMTTVGVYYKLEKRGESRIEDYRRMLVEQLYHSMVNARLDEVLQQPQPPFLFAYSTSAGFVRTRDVYLQVAGVREGEVTSGLQALLTEVERVDRHGFTSSELERMRSEILRQYEQAYAERDKRESGMLAAEYLRNFLEQEPVPGIAMELELARSFLPTIELSELNKLASEWISDSNRVVLISGPEKSQDSLPNRDQLSEVFRQAEKTEVAAYVDRVLDRDLVAEPPQPAAVTQTTQVEEIGATEWRLANGIRVVLKPTDFKNDQILISAFSPGGDSLVSDEDYPSASFATTILGESGLGEFGQIELGKALAGKLVSVSPFISELEEGLTASASPQDLETMFQLLYLTITAPRRDEAAFQSLISRLHSFIENRSARPEAVFQDKVLSVRYGNHPRRQPITPQIIDQIDLDKVLSTYRDRFADSGDFIFIIVGNFTPESIRPLVETYLGGLPVTDREETWRDVNADPLPGVGPVVVEKGLEPKSQVQLFWDAPAQWSRESLLDATALAAAFRIRLREILREDLGAVYGVGVSGSVTPRPKERFRFAVGFGCSPDNVDKLIATVLSEVELLRRDGLPETYAEKVRESERRKRETDLKTNEFWSAVLKTYYSLDLDPRLILEHEALMERITPQQMRETAAKFLNPDSAFQAVLMPEKPVPPGDSQDVENR